MRSLPYSQMLRVRRIVDQEELVDEALLDMIHKFTRRGYPNNLVLQHRNRVKNLSKSEAYRTKDKQTLKRIPLVTTSNDWSMLLPL